MSFKITILGCGSSGGVPRIGGDWGACDASNPKNRRRRCSLLVERFNGQKQVTRILIDTSPDMHAQLTDLGIRWLDGVLYTHEHADHTHGIDDLRALAINGKCRIDTYMNDTTRKNVEAKFSYCFKAAPQSDYPPILTNHRIEAGKPVVIDGPGGAITLLPFEQLHGNISSLGFRIGKIAYSSDLHDLPQTSLVALQELDVWIVDALRYRPHPSHFNVEDALAWIARMKPKHAVLTNMHVDIDYNLLSDELPQGIEPAHDGMVFEFD